VKTPPRVIRTKARAATVRFELAASIPGAAFDCQIDGGAFRNCKPRLALRLSLGRHELVARARSGSGATDPTPPRAVVRVTRR
jgi:hypothetical protein